MRIKSLSWESSWKRSILLHVVSWEVGNSVSKPAAFQIVLETLFLITFCYRRSRKHCF